MKKTLIVAAVSASFAVAAHAQSSVTLYGVIDAGLTYTSNIATANGNGGKAAWQQNSGGIDQSRWGLKGSEDLGNGLKAVFQLESGFDLNNGKLANNGGQFNRQAFVGLSSNYGTVTLGRQFDAAQDYLAPLTATGSWGGTQFAHFGNFDNLNTNGGAAVNNSIKFTSANYAGFTAGATYGFSNTAGQFANNREYSIGAAYQFQGLRVGAAYAQQNNPGMTKNGATDVPAGIEAVGGRAREYGVGASYAFGPAQVGLAWTQARADNIQGVSGGLTSSNYEVNAKYNLTPALGLGVAYTYTSLHSTVQGDAKAHFNQVGAQADYALSKRTDVYTQAVYQRASSNANAQIYSGDLGNGAASGQSQTSVTVGLRHRF
ncbi:porin [Trinickia fusca]|uniref:Porin n=1 Tax=Trinickia fusca TaxID=2419777 RepID=A0A494X8D6_9BURK|nr:porin [Trinickia fusca]RKP44626.1 porin [Trinickia fusca]